MVKQLVFENDAREAVLRGVAKLAKAVVSTLGPRGRKVILDKKFGAALAASTERADRQAAADHGLDVDVEIDDRTGDKQLVIRGLGQGGDTKIGRNLDVPDDPMLIGATAWVQVAAPGWTPSLRGLPVSADCPR